MRYGWRNNSIAVVHGCLRTCGGLNDIVVGEKIYQMFETIITDTWNIFAKPFKYLSIEASLEF